VDFNYYAMMTGFFFLLIWALLLGFWLKSGAVGLMNFSTKCGLLWGQAGDGDDSKFVSNS
jgi:hypothetical protein